MRGNHHFWGRQDYREPPPMPVERRELVALCDVSLVTGTKTWWRVNVAGVLLGYVSTRAAGQVYRAPDGDGWMFAAGDWNRTDPQHGHAILSLLDAAAHA
ncbi:hypothetical protein AB4Y43_17105 [Paraburkholderia sp. BR10872]